MIDYVGFSEKKHPGQYKTETLKTDGSFFLKISNFVEEKNEMQQNY